MKRRYQRIASMAAILSIAAALCVLAACPADVPADLPDTSDTSDTSDTPDTPDTPEVTDEGSDDSVTFQRALEAEAWHGEISLSVDATKNLTDAYGMEWTHDIFKWARFHGDLTRSGLLGAYWEMTIGDATSELDLDSRASMGGVTSRDTEQGSQDIPIGAIVAQSHDLFEKGVFLVPDSASSSFIIHIPAIQQTAHHIAYIDGDVFDEFDVLTFLPEAVVEGIHLVPADGPKLSGSRTLKKSIFGASGDAVEVEVSVTWELEPTIVLPPLEPID